MTRARAAELQAAAPEARPPERRAARGASDRRAALEAMTTDVKLLLAGGLLALLAGFGWLAFGPRSEPYPSVLGYVDAGPPRPTPRPTPPFKLPWWK